MSNPPSPHDRFLQELRGASPERRAAAKDELLIVPGINDDLEAFGEIVTDAEVAKQLKQFMEECDRGEHPLSPEDEAALERAKSELPAKLRVMELQREIHDAHAACDGIIARDDGESLRPLAERVAALRRIVEDRAAAYQKLTLTDEEEELRQALDIGICRICWFFAGALTGVLLLWGFLSLG